MLSSSELKNWPIFTILEPQFISKVCMVIVHDYSGNKALLVTNDNMVYAIGTNTNGCLGTGDTCDTFDPIIVKELCKKDIKTFAFGKDHVLALTNQGMVYSWGQNDYGQLGNGCYQRSLIPTIVTNPVRNENITDIACGSYHSLALTNEGKLENHKMGRVLDVAASYCNDISVAMGEKNVVFVWGRCLEQRIRVPTYRPLKHMHDAFAFYSSRCVTHQPLIVYGKPTEASLIDCLWNAFNDPTTSDLIIKVQGKPIYVHKAILKIRCRYLRRKFDKDWDKQNQSVIEIEEFSYNAYAGFLQYLYTSEINLLVEDVAEIFHIADTYSEDELKGLCIFRLEEGITIGNVISVYNNAVEYKAKEIQEYCLNFAANRITVMLRTPGFVELNGDTFKIFVRKAVENGAFNE